MKTQDEKIMHGTAPKTDNLLIVLMVFAVGGVFGFIFEELFYMIDLGHLVKRGITFGPWIPIYGVGAVLILLFSNRLRHNPVKVFVVSMLVCGTLEYITGYALFRVGGIRLWDYNTEIWNWGNLGGYVCARSILFFGISALFLLYVVYPLILRVRKKYGEEKFKTVSLALSAAFLADIIISLICRINAY